MVGYIYDEIFLLHDVILAKSAYITLDELINYEV